MVLARIEEITGKPAAALFDVIAGTSTGGILALGLTCPGAAAAIPLHSAADLLGLYVQHGGAIFQRTILTGAENVIHEKYPNRPLEEVLQQYFGEARLKDAVTRVTVTAYETELRQPFFFRSVRAAQDPAAYDFAMRDVARATSAAPTYFEPMRLPSSGPAGYFSLVDGGVFANNPGLCAYVDALAEVAHRDEVLMVSLGTGSLTRPLQYDHIRHWGELEWVQPVINVMMDGVSTATDFHLAAILGPGNYHRLQTTLDRASDEMDDASPDNLRNLQVQAETLIRDSEAVIQEICSRLLSGT